MPEAEAEQALFKQALENPALAGRMMHNNFMYQDPEEGPSILNVNASILEAEIEYRRHTLRKKMAMILISQQHLTNFAVV